MALEKQFKETTETDPVYRSIDEESLRAFDANGHCVGQPIANTFYPTLEVYSPAGKLIATVSQAYVKPTPQGEKYDYDVYGIDSAKDNPPETSPSWRREFDCFARP